MSQETQLKTPSEDLRTATEALGGVKQDTGYVVFLVAGGENPTFSGRVQGNDGQYVKAFVWLASRLQKYGLLEEALAGVQEQAPDFPAVLVQTNDDETEGAAEAGK